MKKMFLTCLLFSVSSASAYAVEVMTIIGPKVGPIEVLIPKQGNFIKEDGPSLSAGSSGGGSSIKSKLCAANTGTRTTAADALRCGFNDISVPNLADVIVQ